MMTAHRTTQSREAFTLIEVLMAAFIIALGVLGLSALFAGAARQQQVASQTTSAVVVSNNAEAIVARNFGAIDGPGLVGTQQGVWYPIPTPTSAGASANEYSRNDYLSIDAADASGDIDGSVYFLVDEPQSLTLMEWPQRQDLDTIHRYDGTLASANLLAARGVTIRDFPHGRLEPTSISEVRVTLGPTDDNSTQREQIVSFSYVHGSEVRAQVESGELPSSPDQGNAQNDWGSLPSQPDNPDRQDDDEVLARLFPNGAVNYSSYIVIDIGLGADTSTRYTDPLPARITALNIGPVRDITGLQIRRVEVIGYKWRNDRLISLEDRIVSKEDSSVATGRRPDIGYSLLYRRFNTGASQIGIFTYQINAVDGTALRPTGGVRAGEPLFVPKERRGELLGDEGPIRQANVQLAYDNTNKVYYLSAPFNRDNPNVGIDDRWVCEPGQLLVIAERATASQITGLRAGADQAVRVLRTTRDGDRVRADLDRVPRAAGESMLVNLNQTLNVTVWGVQETVKSRRGNSTWKLSPLDYRVIQVR